MTTRSCISRPRYGDPNCTDRLNTIVFRFPVLSVGFMCDRPESLILLIEPAAISIEEPGLYLEGGLVMQDFIEDFHCFFHPIKRALMDLFEAAGQSKD